MKFSWIGLFLVAWGLYELARIYGYVSASFPFFPAALVVLGLAMIWGKARE
ncbi:MAG: hypothetical protein V1787_03960 [Candidatus Micrarchaeota archaeon]